MTLLENLTYKARVQSDNKKFINNTFEDINCILQSKQKHERRNDVHFKIVNKTNY